MKKIIMIFNEYKKYQFIKNILRFEKICFLLLNVKKVYDGYCFITNREVN